MNPILHEFIPPQQAHKFTSSYVGRFAPSPSGPLHFGSLACALASFLHAKQAKGNWLVRIEDIDTPRTHESLSQNILQTLAAHGLHADKEVVYQRQRHHLYEKTLAMLNHNHSLYACQCSRKDIRARANYYDQYCLNRNLPFDNAAIRWQNKTQQTEFSDLHYGSVAVDPDMATEDPIMKRADGVYAYHLAVVADDIDQGITHIVRGSDLIETTVLHISLFKALGKAAPQYLHIPIAVGGNRQKLSKQHFAPALDNSKALDNLKSALIFLGLEAKPMVTINDIATLIDWAIIHWQSESLSLQTEILVSHTNGVYCIDK